MMRSTGYYYTEEYLDHVPPHGHPERPDRLSALQRRLQVAPVWERLVRKTPAAATATQIRMIHTAAHLDFLRSTCDSGGGMVDEGDTHVVPRSYQVALLAAGAAIAAVDAVVGRELDAAFCAVRPPGHHAERDRAMGFCLFNNAAIAARHAQQAHGKNRVAILDWDVHHGNGTQHIFEDDPSVFYISLHQYPLYPGTGARTERGTGEGEGYTLNIPLPAGTGEERYLEAFSSEIMPALEAYAPDLLIVSAGFDAHCDDPLGGMKLTEESFARFTRTIRPVAPMVSILEGGYDLNALGRCVEQHIGALMIED